MKRILNRNFLMILCASFVLSIGLCASALYISHEYFKTHAFFYDPVGDFSRTIPFYERMQEEAHLNQVASRINFAKLWFQGDPKSPFLYIPTILFFPKLLATPWAIMPAMIFTLTLFLCMLGYAIYIRKHSLLHIFTVLLLFSSALFLLNPERGLAAGWLDLPASFLLATGIISFLNYRDFKKQYWLIISAICIALASMSRSTIIAYAAILLSAPIIITYIENKRALLKHLILYIVSILLLITPFYYYSFEFNYKYYTSLNSGIASSILESFLFFLHTFSIIGIVSFFVFMLFVLFTIFIHRKTSVIQSKHTLFIYAWIVTILPIVWVLIQNTGSTYHVYLTLYSLLFVLFIGIKPYTKQLIEIRLSYSLIIFSIAATLYSFFNHVYAAQNPTVEEVDTKQLYCDIAKYVAQLQPQETWLAYFDEDVTRIANVEAYSQYGVYPRKYAQGILYFHHSYWTAQYGLMTDAAIADSLVNLLSNNSFIVIPHSHENIDSIISDKFSTTRMVLHASLEYCKNNNWELRDSFKTLKYGVLNMYYNRDL